MLSTELDAEFPIWRVDFGDFTLLWDEDHCSVEVLYGGIQQGKIDLYEPDSIQKLGELIRDRSGAGPHTPNN